MVFCASFFLAYKDIFSFSLVLVKPLYVFILSLSILFRKLFCLFVLTKPFYSFILKSQKLQKGGIYSMEVYERIRILRKEVLKMSQEAFAERLGVSRSVIKNIELNALARPDQKLSLYKLICSEFNISEEWLLNGTGDMYASNEAEYSALIDRVMTGQNEFAKNIFKTFALFDEADWEALRRMIDKYIDVADAEDVPEEKPLYDDVPDTPEELEKQYPPVDNGGNSDVG
nr:MAG TPA: helix-turn-helix domain protein [Caudoviricetes sp.]